MTETPRNDTPLRNTHPLAEADRASIWPRNYAHHPATGASPLDIKGILSVANNWPAKPLPYGKCHMDLITLSWHGRYCG